MKSFLKEIPIPICGLILGISSLGNLLTSDKLFILGNLAGIIATILMIFMVVKIMVLLRNSFTKMWDPIIASVAPTFTMALMILSGIWKRWGLGVISNAVWVIAVILQFFLIGVFVYVHLIKKRVKLYHVYPSWFVTFVGIGVIPVTANQFFPSLGAPILQLSLLTYGIMFPIVCFRLVRHKLPIPTKPLLTIMAAPASLCLTGYLSIAKNPNFMLSAAGVIFAQFLYWATLILVTRYMFDNFYPSFAAFTFPLVISATALTRFTNTFRSLEVMNILSDVELAIAGFVVIFVLIKYLNFILQRVEIKNI